MKRIWITVVIASLLMVLAAGCAGGDDAAEKPTDDTPEAVLSRWLAAKEMSLKDLKPAGQLVLAVAEKPNATRGSIYCFAYDSAGDAWIFQEAIGKKLAYFGYNGISHQHAEGDGASPIGLYALTYAFGNAQEPEGLKVPWRPITPYSDWVGDATSPYYNTWQERNDPAITQLWDFDSSEHLEDYPKQYAYSMVIDYNSDPVVPGKGSAIFFHCSTGSTAGCIGMKEGDFLQVLQWLDSEKAPYIFITGEQLAG